MSRHDDQRAVLTHTILVVEDEPVLRASMVRGLAKLAGVEVVATGTVREAKETIALTPPDLVIADLDLPDGLGIEVVGALDRVGIRVPVVFVSAFVGQYQGILPKRAGIEIFEKPVSLDRLRRLVDERLNADQTLSSSPFGVADYIQLAGMGRRSVVIEVRGRTSGHGEILIRAGEVWSAQDDVGEGQDAFRRLAFLRDAVITCRPLGRADGTPRSITGSCESVLLEAARVKDESDPSIPPPPLSVAPTTPPTTLQSAVSTPDEGWDELLEESPEASSETPNPSFALLYEIGVDALLAKNFDGAYDAFARADQLSPGDSRVEANLERLRQMGFGPRDK